MLSRQEYLQIKWSIETMQGYRLNGVYHVPVQNVLGLLERYQKGIKEKKSKVKK